MKSTLLNSIWVLSLLASVAMPIRLAAQERSGNVKECSNATLQGSFGYTGTGTLLPVYAPPPFAGPFGEVGRQTFDGKGHTDATATLSANGNIQQVTIEGTYTVNSDCTGSMTLNVSPLQSTVHAGFVIDRDVAELRAIGTDSGLVETRVYRKQFRGDHEEHAKLTDNSFWDTSELKPPNDTLGASSGYDQQSMIALASSPFPDLGATVMEE